MEHNNLSKTILQVDEAINKTRGDVPYVYIGGIPTDLLNHENTTIDASQKLVVTNNPAIKATRENGTPRDIDLLYLTDDRQALEEFHAQLSSKIYATENGRVPLISISSYEAEVKKRAYFQLVSQCSRNGEDINFSVGDITESVNAASFEDLWSIRFQGGELPILHPVAHMYRYRVRSIAGLRKKDREKVELLNEKLKQHISPDDYQIFEPLLKLEERLKVEISFKGLLREASTRRAALLLSKKLLQTMENNPKAMAFLQRDTPLVKAAVRRVIRSSGKNFFDIDQEEHKRTKK